MKVPFSSYRCPLGRFQPQTTDVEAIKRSGWRDQHILVIAANDERLDWMEKELIRQLGERLYGGGTRRG